MCDRLSLCIRVLSLVSVYGWDLLLSVYARYHLSPYKPFTGLSFMGDAAVLPVGPPLPPPYMPVIGPLLQAPDINGLPLERAVQFLPCRSVTGFLVYTCYRFGLYKPVISSLLMCQSSVSSSGHFS